MGVANSLLPASAGEDSDKRPGKDGVWLMICGGDSSFSPPMLDLLDDGAIA